MQQSHGNVKHYFKGCFPEVIFKIEDQVKVIEQPFEKNYALAKAVIDIKKNYMWTGQEIARGRMKYRIWGIKLIIYVLIVTAILFALIFYALAGTGGLLFFNDIGIQVTLLDLFHKSKNDLSLADYLYRRILNIHA